MRNLPQLLRDAERRVNAHVWPNHRPGADAHLASIPANRDTDTDLLLGEAADRIEEMEAALVYSAFAQHRTPLYMLPEGVSLIDNDRVEVVLADGRKVTARSGGSEHG